MNELKIIDTTRLRRPVAPELPIRPRPEPRKELLPYAALSLFLVALGALCAGVYAVARLVEGGS